MSKIKLFNVSQSKGGPSYDGLKLEVGSTPDDAAWQDLNLTQADINDKAIQSVVIDLQGAMRRNWPKNQAEAQAFVDNWAAGRRASAAVRLSTETVKELKLTAAQIAGLRAAGVQF